MLKYSNNECAEMFSTKHTHMHQLGEHIGEEFVLIENVFGELWANYLIRLSGKTFVCEEVRNTTNIILDVYKGSAWVPAFAGAHASGRAGQHFDNLRCSCPIWHALNFEVMPRV